MTKQTMTTRAFWTTAAVCLSFLPAPARAADREHQQIMAEVRMLHLQTQQLQSLMNDLGEALRLVNSRLDEQASMERKAFADGKVQMDAISGDLRIVREKVDETNVRLGSLSQEVESLRQAIPEPALLNPLGASPDTSAAAGIPSAPGGPAPSAAAAAPPAPTNVNHQRLFDSAMSDYYLGNYSLAVAGFQSYLDYLPKGVRAHEAQLFIGESLHMDKKDAEAVTAYDRVIANYPSSPSIPQAYYKRGLTLQRMGQKDRARESFEALIKQFPNSDQSTLAKQRLQ